MTTPESKNVTRLLIAWGQGDESARDELIPLVYETLRRIRGGLDFVGRFQIEGRPQFVPEKERIGVSPLIHFNVESIT